MQDSKKLFISYSRQSEPVAVSLRTDIEQLSHDATLIPVMDGAQGWWNEICLGIEECELLILVLDQNWRTSESCKSQWRYARKLELPILPVRVDDVSVDLLPPELAKYQQVDYSNRDKKSAYSLVRNINEAPSRHSYAGSSSVKRPPLPERSCFQDLKNRVQLASRLRPEEQLSFSRKLLEEHAPNEELSKLCTSLTTLQQLSSTDDHSDKLIKKTIELILKKSSDEPSLNEYLSDYKKQGKTLLRWYPIVTVGGPILFLGFVATVAFSAVFGAYVFEDLLGWEGWSTTGGAVGGVFGFWLSIVVGAKVADLLGF